MFTKTQEIWGKTQGFFLKTQVFTNFELEIVAEKRQKKEPGVFQAQNTFIVEWRAKSFLKRGQYGHYFVLQENQSFLPRTGHQENVLFSGQTLERKFMAGALASVVKRSDSGDEEESIVLELVLSRAGEK